MSIPGIVDSSLTLALMLEDGNGSMYPQTKIYEPSNSSPLATIDLTHISAGRYEGSWTPTSIGSYSAHYITYSDASHTIESFLYTREIEQIFVAESDIDDLATLIVRLLGMNHENAFIDNTSHDAHNQLLTARVRLFDSKTNALAATDGGSETTGLIATYSMTTQYEVPGRMKQYRMVRDA